MERVRAVNYSDLERRYSARARLRAAARSTAVFLLALTARRMGRGSWIRFPFYHHVFDDQRAGFERQLRQMKQVGDFLSLDDAITLLEQRAELDGRYFCITFDDGFQNCESNAVPILVDLKCPAAFFLPTDYIGRRIDADWQAVEPFFAASRAVLPIPLEFLDWDACRRMQRAGMSFGSHTRSHARLSRLVPERVKQELSESKERLERELGRPCDHFACPWGVPGADYRADADPHLAKSLGYRSFLTTVRGPTCRGADPLAIRRDHLLAGWGNFQLRYFFSRPCSPAAALGPRAGTSRNA